MGVSGLHTQTSDGKVHMHRKGAAEIILDLCSLWMDFDCNVHRLTSEKVWSNYCIICCTCQLFKTSKAAVICKSLHKFLHSCEGAIIFIYWYLASFLQRDELGKVIEGMAALMLRCIAFAHHLIEELEVPLGKRLRPTDRHMRIIDLFFWPLLVSRYISHWINRPASY